MFWGFNMNQDLIVHICSKTEWHFAQGAGAYQPTGLELDGFIHCSRLGQVLKVANRFYAGLDDLVLLCIDPQKLVPELRWEAAEGDIFPHIYGPLNLDAVVGVVDFNPDLDGVFRMVPSFGP